ncbi:Arabinanolytic transcriptional activator araR [Fusarium oxysporum f. sp. albedinis]|nr:Arabinanolytic transcriptional activator araR [Fusarium oxysporum f. sp. albedinis]
MPNYQRRARAAVFPLTFATLTPSTAPTPNLFLASSSPLLFLLSTVKKQYLATAEATELKRFRSRLSHITH